MIRFALAAATAAAVFTAASSFGGVVPAKAANLRMAQVVIETPGHDRDVREERAHRDRRDSDVTVGVGPGGIRVGPREEHCRMVTTKVQRGDGSSITREERRCD